MKSWFFMLLLFLVSVLLITPTAVIDNLQPLINAIEKYFNTDSYISYLIATYVTPLMILLFNVVIIPCFIDLISMYEDHKSKSLRQVSIMNKNFCFMFINTIFLPLFGMASIKSLLEYLSTKNWEDISTALAINLVTNNTFFLRYIIQLTFISNGI